MIHPNDVAVVVHTCPARRTKLGPLLDSIESSDIDVRDAHKFELAVEPEGASNFEKRLHYLSLLCRNARRGKYVLRLEDDVIVNRHIMHNIVTWPALRNPEFGMGLLFVDDRLYEAPEASELQIDGDGMAFRRCATTQWAQAHLFQSETLLKAAAMYFSVLAEKRRWWDGLHIERLSLAFDWAVTTAVGKLGRRVYLHKPSLVDCTEVSLHRAYDGAEVKYPHRASDFTRHWRRGD